MNTTTLTKRCIHCKRTLPLSDYSRNPRNPDGLTNVCDACREKTNYNRNKDRIAGLPHTEPAQWERLAGDVIEWYYKGLSFDTMGKRIRDRAKKIIEEQKGA